MWLVLLFAIGLALFGLGLTDFPLSLDPLLSFISNAWLSRIVGALFILFVVWRWFAGRKRKNPEVKGWRGISLYGKETRLTGSDQQRIPSHALRRAVVAEKKRRVKELERKELEKRRRTLGKKQIMPRLSEEEIRRRGAA